MRNIVTRFRGRSENEENEDLIKVSLYYGLEINATNCFNGNNKVFRDHYKALKTGSVLHEVFLR